MAFDRPDLPTLISRTGTDLRSRFPDGGNRLRRMVLGVLGRVLAGLCHGLYGYMDWVSRQIHTSTMDQDRLLRDGAIYGVPYEYGAKAGGNLVVTGTDGATVVAGDLWQQEDGTEYTTLADTVISGSTDVAVEATAIGAAGNAAAGTAVTIVSPRSGVTPSAVVASGGITGGVDTLALETYRSRVMLRKAIFITGANVAIYKKWALEISGVTRAWVYERTPAGGSVKVLFMTDDEANPIPTAGKVTEVAAYMEEHTDPATGIVVGRGVNVTLVVAAPTAQTVNFTILPSPNTTAVKAAITAELTDMLRRDAAPGATIKISRIREAISIAAGEDDYVLSAPTADVSVAAGYIAVLGTITWA